MSNNQRFSNLFAILDESNQEPIPPVSNHQEKTGNGFKKVNQGFKKVNQGFKPIHQKKGKTFNGGNKPKSQPNRRMTKEEFFQKRMQSSQIEVKSTKAQTHSKPSQIKDRVNIGLPGVLSTPKLVYKPKINSKPKKIKIFYGRENKFINFNVNSTTQIGKIVRAFNQYYPHHGERSMAIYHNQVLPYYARIEDYGIQDCEIIELIAGKELQPLSIC